MDKNISESASDFIRTPNLEKLSKNDVMCVIISFIDREQVGILLNIINSLVK